ncbi:MAG TPA: GGDEF domain-containing protein [Cellulomonadaceae bacterium]|nr:GGDEF domain-containing protein [Cellulomonadaceae bacterium]
MDAIDTDFYAHLLDRVSDGVYFVSRDRRITYWSAGAEHVTGYTAESVVGRSCAEGILRHVNDAGRQVCLHGCPLAGVMKDGRPREARMYLHHQDGHRVPVTIRSEAIRDASGRIVGAAEVFSPRGTPRVRDDLRTQDDPAHDPVTGVTSRRFGEMALAPLFQAVAEGTTTLGVLFLDVDHFKDVNDTYGHRVGDEVLRMVGQSVAGALRRDDTAIRWGGEEFVALLPGVGLSDLEVVAERVRMLVENSWLVAGDAEIRVTVSVGATIAQRTDAAVVVVDRADRLMYESKRSGRNCVTADSGRLVSRAERPLVGAGVPWETPGVDGDGDGDGDGEGHPDPAPPVR